MSFKTKCVLRELQKPLKALLDEVMASDLKRRPFVIVEGGRPRRFVQFARLVKPPTGELLFDVPMLNIVLKPCPDTATGASWAYCELIGSLALSPDDVVQITLDGDPAS